MSDRDLTCMSYWFPKLAAVPGVSVPRTTLISADADELLHIIDGKRPPAFDKLVDEIRSAAYGWPMFLRTGYGSGKHNWLTHCYVQSPEDVAQHVLNLVEWSCCVDFLGLPIGVWAVREMLPTESLATAWGGMPITQERRFFIEGGRVVCHHPYWPLDVLDDYRPTDKQRRALQVASHLAEPDLYDLTVLSELVSEAIPGAWSLDWLAARDGWYAIDMAVAERSYHMAHTEPSR